MEKKSTDGYLDVAKSLAFRMENEQEEDKCSYLNYTLLQAESRKACFQNSYTPLCHRLHLQKLQRQQRQHRLEVGCLPPAA